MENSGSRVWKPSRAGPWGTHAWTGSLTPALRVQEELFIKFAEFEERCKEHERARAIYKYALDHIPKAQADGVYQRFVVFEKQHGDREGIEVGAQKGVTGSLTPPQLHLTPLPPSSTCSSKKDAVLALGSFSLEMCSDTSVRVGAAPADLSLGQTGACWVHAAAVETGVQATAYRPCPTEHLGMHLRACACRT